MPHGKILLAQSFAPHAGAGTYFRERTKVSKGLPKDTFGIRSGNGPRKRKQKLLKRRSNENAHSPSFIGKSVLLSRLSAGIFRALSLARCFLVRLRRMFYWLTECFSYHFRRESFPYVLASRAGRACAWNRTRAGASLGFQRQSLWSLSGGSKGERIETPPLANLCFLSFRQERKGPPRPEGHALRKQNSTRGTPAERPCSFKINHPARGASLRQQKPTRRHPLKNDSFTPR